MTRRVELPYGKTSVVLSLPVPGCLLTGSEPPALAEPRAAVRAAFLSSQPPLAEAVSRSGPVTVIVPDQTRVSGTALVIPELLAALAATGAHEVKILIANGQHRPPSPAATEQLLTPEIIRQYPVAVNEPTRPELYVQAGQWRDGTPIRIHQWAAEAQAIILVGAVSLHYLAGFGGGRKLLVPGVADQETLTAAHAATMDWPHGGRHALARTGQLAGNPFHEALLDAQRQIKPAYGIFTVLRSDKQVAFAAAGEPEEAFPRAAAFVREWFMPRAARRFSTVIVSAGGHPRDSDVIQAHKALEHAAHLAAPGAKILWLAECAGGLGHPSFEQYAALPSAAAIVARLKEQFAVYGQTVLALRAKTKNFRVALLSALGPEWAAHLGVTLLQTPAAAENWLAGVAGADPEIAVIPNGGAFCFQAPGEFDSTG